MRTKSFSLEIVALLVLILIPWPGPTVFKISCPRDSARVVRKLIQKKWLPILEKRSVKLGMECPFHHSRDIFGSQQTAKQQHRPSQWTCAFCGKSFYTERHLDAHFDSRHRDSINMAEDAVCLADYCDVMRCEVLAAREAADNPGGLGGGTDIEVWRHSSAHRTALSVSAPRDLARVAAFPSLHRGHKHHHQHHTVNSANHQQQPQSPRCPPLPGGARGAAGSKEREGDANATADMCGKAQSDLVDSAMPPHSGQGHGQGHGQAEMQRFKADCKPDELLKLKTRCEILVRDCIAGLLVNLSVQDFKEIEEELNRASCWYLTCDRYWEDSPPEARASPWALLALMAAMLVFGVIVCYYIIWVLFDSPQEPWCDSPWGPPRNAPVGGHVGGVRADPSILDHGYDGQGTSPDGVFHDDLDAHGDQYIYVTYSPDVRRRLLERPVPGQPSSAPTPQSMTQPMMAPQHHHQHHQHHPHHYSVHPMHVSPSPHLSHVSQMSHMQHLAQMPRGSHHVQASPKQDPFEREWRI